MKIRRNCLFKNLKNGPFRYVWEISMSYIVQPVSHIKVKKYSTPMKIWSIHPIPSYCLFPCWTSWHLQAIDRVVNVINKGFPTRPLINGFGWITKSKSKNKKKWQLYLNQSELFFEPYFWVNSVYEHFISRTLDGFFVKLKTQFSNLKIIFQVRVGGGWTRWDHDGTK